MVGALTTAGFVINKMIAETGPMSLTAVSRAYMYMENSVLSCVIPHSV